MPFPDEAPKLNELIRPDTEWSRARPNFYIHPDYPDILVRHTIAIGEKYVAGMAIDNQVATETAKTLWENHGIPCLTTELLVDPTPRDNSGPRHNHYDTFHIADIIHDGIDLERLVQRGQFTSEVFAEADRVYCGLIDWIQTLMFEGGFFMDDITGLSQFIYSPSRPEGQRVVLVDTVTDGFKYVAPADGPNAVANIAKLMDYLVFNVAESLIEMRAAGRSGAAIERMYEFLATIPQASPEIVRAVEVIKWHLEQGRPGDVEEYYMEGEWADYSAGLYGSDDLAKWQELRGK